MKLTNYLRVLLFVAISVPFAHAQEEDVLRPHGRPLSAEELSKYSWTNHPEKIPLTVGIYGGVSSNAFSQSVTYGSPAVKDPLETALSSGTGLSPHFGLLFDYAISPNAAVQLRAEYDMKSFSNTVAGGIDVTDPNGFIIQNIGASTAKYEASVSYLNIIPTLRYNIDERIFVSFGLCYQMQMGDFSRTDNISKTNPLDSFWYNMNFAGVPGQFQSVEKTVNYATSLGWDGSANPVHQSYNTGRIGIVPGLGFLLPLGRTLALAAELRYQYMLTKLYDDFDALDITRVPTNVTATTVTYSNPMLHSLQVSVGLWFKL